MADSTVISAARPQHRTARISGAGFQGALALDWANGQAFALGAGSAKSTVFDANNDRVVSVSVGGASTVVGAWITVGANPVAAAAAGSMWIGQSGGEVNIYVPAGMLIAAVQGATGGTLSMIPALLAGS